MNNKKNKPKKQRHQYSQDDTDKSNYIFSDDEYPSSKFQLYHKKNKHVPIRKIHKRSEVESLIFDKDILEKVNDVMKKRINIKQSNKNGIDSDDNIVINSSSDESVRLNKTVIKTTSNSDKENIIETSANIHDHDLQLSNNDKKTKKINDSEDGEDENIPLSKIKDKNDTEKPISHEILTSNIHSNFDEAEINDFDDNNSQDEYASQDMVSQNDNNKIKKFRWCICESDTNPQDSVSCGICGNWYHKKCFITTQPYNSNLIDDVDEGDNVCCYCNEDLDMIKKYADGLRSRGININIDVLGMEKSKDTNKVNQTKIVEQSKKKKSLLSSSESDEEEYSKTPSPKNGTNHQHQPQQGSIIKIKPKFLNQYSIQTSQKSSQQETSKTSPTQKVSSSSLSKINTQQASTQAVSKDPYNNFFKEQNSTKATTSANSTSQEKSIRNSLTAAKKKPNQIKLVNFLPEKRSQIKTHTNPISSSSSSLSTNSTKIITPTHTASSLSTNTITTAQSAASTTSTANVSSKCSIDELRSSSKTKLTNALINKKDSDLNSNDLNITNEQIKELVDKIDEELNKAFPNNLAGKYKQKFITIITNVIDQKNHTFYRKILNGTIKPCELAKMESKNMASDDVIEQRKRQDKEEAISYQKFFEKAREEAPRYLLKTTSRGDVVEIESRDFADDSINSSHKDESKNSNKQAASAPSFLDSLLQLPSITATQIENTLKQNTQNELNSTSKMVIQPIASKVSITNKNNIEKKDPNHISSSKRTEPEVEVHSVSKTSKLNDESNQTFSKPPSRPNTPPCLLASPPPPPQQVTTCKSFETNKELSFTDGYHFDKFPDTYIPPISPSTTPVKNNKNELENLLEWEGFIDNLNSKPLYKTKPYVKGNILMYEDKKKLLTKSSFASRVSHQFLKNQQELKLIAPKKRDVHSEIDRILKNNSIEHCFIQFDINESGKSLMILGLDKNPEVVKDARTYETLFIFLQSQQFDLESQVRQQSESGERQKKRQMTIEVSIPTQFSSWIDKFYIFPLHEKPKSEENFNIYKCPIVRNKNRFYGIITSQPIKVKPSSLPCLDENISLSSSSSTTSIKETTNSNLKKRKSNENLENSIQPKKQKVDSENMTLPVNSQPPIPSIQQQQQQQQISKLRDPRLQRNLSVQSNSLIQSNEPSTTVKQTSSSTSISSSSSSISISTGLTPSNSQDKFVYEQANKFLSSILEETKTKSNEKNNNISNNNV